MTASPRVSVITPCYDPGWRLERCLASVRDQFGADVEHIVVDAASSDGTVELLERTPGITWVSEPDDGQTDAINKGFRMATGDVLTWLGADDALRPDAAARTLEALEGAPSATWTYGDVEVLDPARPYTWRAPDHVDATDLAVRVPIAQPGAFLRREALDAVGPLDQDLRYSMDLDLWLSLFEAGHRPVHVRAVVADFEVHDASKGGSVPYGDFLAEAARIRSRRGLPDAGAATAGRVAAYRADADDALTTARVEAELQRALEELGQPADDAVARPSAHVQAAIQCWRRSPTAALRWVTDRAILREPHARELLRFGVATRVRALVGRDPDLS